MALNIPWDLFRKLLNNSISDEDDRLLQLWREQSELNQNIYDEILDDKQIQSFLINEKPINQTQEWEKLLSRINRSTPKLVFNRSMFYWASGIAASLLLLIGIASGIWFIGKKTSRHPAEYVYVYSPRGQRTHMILPDKSKVWLNSETSIRYTVSFNQKIREVQIEGEAFFQVIKTTDVPFIVNTSDIRIKVYGTSFNVKAYPNEKTIETTLIEGTLSVIPKTIELEKEISLHPMERLTYSKISSELTISSQSINDKKSEHPKADKTTQSNKVTLSKNINPDIEQSWKDGKLLFKDELFSDLAIKLERWYDVKIHFTDERIKSYRFTGKFDKETINEAMEALRASSQQSYRYEIVFRDIYLRAK